MSRKGATGGNEVIVKTYPRYSVVADEEQKKVYKLKE